MGIVVIRKPPTEAQSLTVVPAEEGEGFLVQDEDGNVIATGLTEENAQAYADMLNAGG